MSKTELYFFAAVLFIAACAIVLTTHSYWAGVVSFTAGWLYQSGRQVAARERLRA